MPYYGGKQRIAAKIVETFPPHTLYAEPYCGGLAVLLAKPPSRHEVVNDIDGELMTFWRVLREQPEELIRVCALTPHSRAELALARDPLGGLSELEVARRVWVQLTMGRAGRRARTGLRFYANGESSSTPMARYLAAYVERMPPAAARLADVLLESRDALDLIGVYGRSETSLLYVDPPYLGTTRRNLRYVHEMRDEASHEALAEALSGASASVVLSGYASPLYARLYRDWERVELPARTQSADGARTEVLWLNYTPAAAPPYHTTKDL